MKIVPIYSSNGDWVALVQGRYIYNTRGEWIGWIEGRDAYTRDGAYVGYFSDDRRLLRRRIRESRPLRTPPAPQPPIQAPVRVPLAGMFAELPWQVVDVFEEDPYIFDFVSDLRPDWEG